MKKFTIVLMGIMLAGAAALAALTLYMKQTLPGGYITESDSHTVGLRILDRIPVSQVSQVQTAERRMVVPGGTPFGIKMFTEGVMVVGMSDIKSGMESINPSKAAGIKIGDMIIALNGEPVERSDDVRRIILESGGGKLGISAMRAGQRMEFTLTPVKTEYDDTFKAGIWVRDSSAGIGTLTYYDPATLAFGGLGHAVCDVDTGRLMPLSSGEIVDVNISGSNIGLSGKPGELKGKFNSDNRLGSVTVNSEMGVFGYLSANPEIEVIPIPMAHRHEVKPGAAVMLSTVSGNKPQEFDVVVEKVNYSDDNDTKNMVVRVVDDRLLAATGGIVQGMSGSPIIQDGKLIGAVTHVFVNDPTRGYSIFAENMDTRMISAENNLDKAA
ncbi:MAG: SpoIVB peptidase [Oscillospiraceae bacterium]|nr:SpoIVB peptidase [Oscillospiraceae bacterium]